MSDPQVPPGTDPEEVAPNPAGIPQSDPPEGGPDPETTAGVGPGFGGDADTRPESAE
ncbi:MAG TPA: hypothetical protein VM367_16320 [Pseudonocardia sp.]|jgi:hypothetical protein|nr:hypothetical protein [Pseudonocardia sp.]